MTSRGLLVRPCGVAGVKYKEKKGRRAANQLGEYGKHAQLEFKRHLKRDRARGPRNSILLARTNDRFGTQQEHNQHPPSIAGTAPTARRRKPSPQCEASYGRLVQTVAEIVTYERRARHLLTPVPPPSP